MEEEKKEGNWLPIIVTVIAFLIFLFLITRGRPTVVSSEPQSVAIFATPTLGYIEQTPTPVPTTLNQEETWTFVSMEEKVIYQNGYWYDVGTFQNTGRPDIFIKAMCMAPLWPSPTAGTIYRLNAYNILYPVVDNETNNLQRFQILK